MKTIGKFGLATLAAGAFWVVTLPSKAETPDTFTRHGLPIPGAYFKSKESQKPATVAVSKSGQGVGEQKQTSKTVLFQTPAAKRENHGRSIEQVIQDQHDWYQMFE
jgi:hypothetical protein